MTRTLPFLPWTGGKRRLLEHVLPECPSQISLLVAPFLGGGAVELALLSEPGRVRQAILSDANPRLVRQWEYVRDDPNRVAQELVRLEKRQDHARTVLEYNSGMQGPAHLIWLVCRSFSALYRENRQGEFNAPYDATKKRPLPTLERLTSVTALLNRPGVSLSCTGFREALAAPGWDFAFCDPPYLGTFINYCGAWGESDTRDLIAALRGRSAVLTETTEVERLLPPDVEIRCRVPKRHSNTGSRGLGTVEVVARFPAWEEEW